MTDLAAEDARLRAQLGNLDRHARALRGLVEAHRVGLALRSARTAAAQLRQRAAIERVVGPLTCAGDVPAAAAEAALGPLAALRRAMASAAL